MPKPITKERTIIMKKAFSLILIISMLCTMMHIPAVYAADTLLYSVDEYSEFGVFYRADKQEAFGIGGKDSSDSSLKITMNDSTNLTGYTEFSWGKISGSTGSYTWDKSDFKGYLVNEISVLTDETIAYAWICTNQNSSIGVDASAYLISGRWNRIVTVTDRSGGANNGKTATYVNGVCIKTWTADKLGSLNNSQPRNLLRFLFGGTLTTPVYIDDLKVYETDTLYTPSALSIRGEGFAGTNGYLTVGKNITTADITSAGYKATAYTNSSLTTPLGANEAISQGNIVVVQAEDNSVWYYELSDWNGITEITTDLSKLTLNKASASDVYGVYGKNSNDLSYELIDNNTASDIFYQLSWAPKNAMSNYLVFDMNVASKGNQGYIYLGTNGNSSMSEKAYIGSDVKPHQWNKFTVVYNIAGKKSDAYLNGKCISKDFAGSYTVGTSNCVRFLIVNSDDILYADDLTIYESVGYPDITGAIVPENGLDTESGIITDTATNTLNILENSSLAGTKNLFAPDNVRIFSDAECTIEKAYTDTAKAGDVVVTESANNIYSYYQVATFSKSDIIVMGDSRYNKDYNSLYNGEINIIASVENNGIYVAALYDTEGNLAKLDMNNAVNGYINASFDPGYDNEGYIKLFVWDGKTSLRPVGQKKEITYTNGKVICFLGDSITQNGKYIRELYEHYLANTDIIPGVEMYNCGIPGDKTTQALARIDTDCLNYNPDVVFVCFGVNHLDKKYYEKATYTNYTSQQNQIMETYTDETRQIIEKIQATGATAILCTPPPHNDTASGLVRNTGLAQMTDILYELAEEYDIEVVDYFNAMKDLDYATYIMTDNVHPNDRGHHVMAQTVLNTFGYTDTIDTGDAIATYNGANAKRHNTSYNYRLVLLKDNEFSNLPTIDQRYEAAYAKMLAQTDSHQKFIYQNYCDNCYRIPEMEQEVIALTKQTACK